MLELRKLHEDPELQSRTISSIHIRAGSGIRGYFRRLNESIIEEFGNSGIFHQREEGNPNDELALSTEETEWHTLNTRNQTNIEELSLAVAAEDTLQHVSRVHEQ